jgi:hypothetical protein
MATAGIDELRKRPEDLGVMEEKGVLPVRKRLSSPTVPDWRATTIRT